MPLFRGIRVCDPERHGHGLKDSYISYRVSSRMLDGASTAEEEFNVCRRYRDFLDLQQLLLGALPAIILPPLPEKQSLKQLLGGERFGPDYVKRRQVGLQRWLWRLNRHRRVINCPLFVDFMRTPVMPGACLGTELDILQGGGMPEQLEGDFESAKREIALLCKHLRCFSQLTEGWLKHERGIHTQSSHFNE
jgi:hypothetical protein